MRLVGLSVKRPAHHECTKHSNLHTSHDRRRVAGGLDAGVRLVECAGTHVLQHLDNADLVEAFDIFLGDTRACSMLETRFVDRVRSRFRVPCCFERDHARLSSSHQFSLPFAPFSLRATSLPYLEAVCKEAMRLLPVSQWDQSRTVPAGGATVAGYFVPAGTTVQCHIDSIHRDAEIFGSEPDSYHPERWLNKSDQQLVKMNAAMLGFRAGKRMCLGRHIAWLEMKKLIPLLTMHLDVSRMRGTRNCLRLTDWPISISTKPSTNSLKLKGAVFGIFLLYLPVFDCERRHEADQKGPEPLLAPPLPEDMLRFVV